MKFLIALATAFAVVSLGAGAAQGGGSVTYTLTLQSLTAQPDAQHYGFANFTTTFADGKYHQCCTRVQVVTSCDNGLTEVGGPAVSVYEPPHPTPIIGLFYDQNLQPTICHAWVTRLTDHNKRSGVMSPVVTYAT